MRNRVLFGSLTIAAIALAGCADSVEDVTAPADDVVAGANTLPGEVRPLICEDGSLPPCDDDGGGDDGGGEPDQVAWTSNGVLRVVTEGFGGVTLSRSGGVDPSHPTLVVVEPSYGAHFYLDITWNGDQVDDVWLRTGGFPPIQIVSNGQTVEIDNTAAGAGYSALFWFCDQLRSDFYHELLNVSGFGFVGLAGALAGLVNPPVGVAIEAIAAAGVVNSSVKAFSYFRQWRECEDCVEETGEPC